MASKKPKRYKDTGKYRRLYAMGEDRLSQIDAMLVKGTSALKTAEYIQQTWGLYPDVKVGTLTQQITRYYGEMIKGRAMVTLPGSPKNKRDQSLRVKALEAKVDTLQTLRNMVYIQMERFNKVHLREEPLPTTMDSVRKELELLLKLTDRLATLEMDLGILQRVPRGIQLELPGSLRTRAEEARLTSEIKDRLVEASVAAEVFALLEQDDIINVEYTEVTEAT